MILRLMIALLTAGVPASAVTATGEPVAAGPDWMRPSEPFRIAGNLYYVGSASLSAFLLTDPAGHVLIDGAMPQNADQIAGNIRRLGFRVEDIRIMLNNHAHPDHSGGLARLKQLSGAQLLASAADRPALESGTVSYRDEYWFSPPVAVDRTIADRETIRLGGLSLTAHLTPGHTKGCTSWTTRVVEQGRPLDVIFTCSLTVAGQDLEGDPRYANAAADFERTYARLRTLSADIFLAFHDSQFGLETKRNRLATDSMAFVDRAELASQVDRAEAAFRGELERQRSSAGSQ